MKQLLIFSAIVFTMAVSGCKAKQETCATYSKQTKVVKSDRVNS